MQRTCAQAIKKEELYIELINVKINLKTGNALENYMNHRMKVEQEELEIRKQEGLAETLAAISNLLKSQFSANLPL